MLQIVPLDGQKHIQLPYVLDKDAFQSIAPAW